MRKLILWAVALGLAASVELRAQEVYQPLPAEEMSALPESGAALAEIEGQVEAVDLLGRRLTLKDSTGNPVVVRVVPRTRIMNPNNRDLRLTELEPHDRVRIYYNRADESAQQIDRLPTAADAILNGD